MSHPSPLTGTPLRTVSGLFFRAVGADRATEVLAPPGLASAGRYHRLGQAALYMSPKREWAVAAVSGYMREDGHARVLVPLRIGEAHVLDQHDEAACASLGLDRERSNQPWRAALQAGREPPSWQASDAARGIGADGLIDRSRHIPGGWHLTLFRWNEAGAPSVEIVGEAEPIHLSPDGAKWGP